MHLPSSLRLSVAFVALSVLGCAGSESASVGASEAATSAGAIVFSPTNDPALSLSVELVEKNNPDTGPANVEVTLARGSDKQVVPCDRVSAGGNDGDAERLWCELSRGREENEVHERFVLAIQHEKSHGADVYTLTDALHEEEGTDWVPMIDLLFPAWRTQRFSAEPLKVVTPGAAAKNPFTFIRRVEDLLDAASVGLELPNVPSKIGTAPGVQAPTAPGPFAVSNPGVALWGDYSTSFVFTIGQGVWFNLSDVSVFTSPKEAWSGLVSADVLRDRIRVSADPAATAAHDALVAKIKAAYEAAIQHGADKTFPDEVDVDSSKLEGAAKEAFDEYENCSNDGLHADVGGPIVRMATLDGKTVYFVAGDVSDTGSEYGFYDANGDLLALAYTGQGEHPGDHGVDWEY